jgi:circadian clock protein KaiB
MLFVSGMSVKSGHAIENLRRICDTYFTNNYEIEIIDISRDKEQAILHQIVAIPTLIRTVPAPRRIILGDLSDKDKVLKILNIIE